MACAALFEPSLSFVWWMAVALLGIVALMMLVVVSFRLSSLEEERRRRRFVDTWTPIMMESLQCVPDNLPKVEKEDCLAFLSDWTHLHESVLGECKASLNELARRTGMQEVAVQLMQSGSPRERLVAVAAAGHMRLTSAWRLLRQLSESDEPVISVAAARSLVLINPARAATLVVRQISRRDDWPATKIAGLLREAGAENVSAPFAIAALYAKDKSAARLVKFLGLIDMETASETVQHILTSASEPATIAACMSVIRHPDQIDLVKRYLDHENAQVRLGAADALSRIGSKADKHALISQLDDSHWEVRFSSAQSLVKMPFVDVRSLKELHDSHEDSEARDILAHVIAESKQL